MTKTITPQSAASAAEASLLATLVPRLPRIAAVTVVAVFTTFAAIQFIPQNYEARLKIGLPAGSAPDLEAARLTSQEHLGDIVARLSPEIIAELRRNGGGVLDTTALLQQRLKLVPDIASQGLELAATAGTAARARAIAEATAASYAALGGAQPLPVALADAVPSVPVISPAVGAANTGDSAQLLQQRLSLAWEDRVKLENRVRRIQSLVASSNYEMLALDADGLPGLGRKLDELASLEAEREKLSVTFLPNHPTMRALDEQVAELSEGLEGDVQRLAELVVADRDAARRLEDQLRDELATAMVPMAVDDAIMTGAIGDATAKTETTALPRPVRTDLALAFAGGLAFFGQVGLLAFLRSRRLNTEHQHDESEMVSPPFDDVPVILDPVPQPVSPHVQPAGDQTPAHDWLASALPSGVSVAAGWLGENFAVQPPSTKPENSRRAPKQQVVPLAARLMEARTVVVHAPGGAAANVRTMLARYADQQKRVVLVDASTRHRSRALGISDLSQGLASFADIVHGSGAHEAAFVPWGRQPHLDAGARPVLILIEALSALYDVVIITLDRDHPAAGASLRGLADLVIDIEELQSVDRKAA